MPYNGIMDLKAFAAAIFVAFITVIIDAVFNFHYIYVLVILVIMGYALSRLISIVGTARSAASETVPDPGKSAVLGSLLQTAAKIAGITLEMETEMNEVAQMDKKAFPETMASVFRVFGRKAHGKTVAVRSGKRKMVHLTLTFNCKAGPFQKELDHALTAFVLLVSRNGGTAWQTDIPRKTELHALIPGN